MTFEKNPVGGQRKRLSWGMTFFIVVLASVLVVMLFVNMDKVTAGCAKLGEILRPVIIGAALAFLLTPVYNAVDKWFNYRFERVFRNVKTRLNLGKTAGTVASAFLVLFIVFGLISVIIPQLIESMTAFVENIPASYDKALDFLDDFVRDNEDRIMLTDALNKIAEYIQTFTEKTILPNIDNIAAGIFSGVKSVALGLYNALIGFIVMIYLLNFKQTLLPQIKKLCYAMLPENWAGVLMEQCRYAKQTFYGFFVGKVVDSAIIGAICLIVTAILKMPYVALLATVVGVTNIIPFFGPFIGGIPCSLLVLLADAKKGIIFILFIIILQQIDGNIIGPKLLGDQTGLRSFWVLFSIILFGGLFGFVGMLIAVPAWAVILHIIGDISNARLRKKGLPISSEDYVDR